MSCQNNLTQLSLPGLVGNQPARQKVTPPDKTENSAEGRKLISYKGNLNPNWHGGNVALKCMVCEAPFEVIPSRATKAVCCSLPCWNEYQKDNEIARPNRRLKSTKGVRKKKWILVECRGCNATFEVPPSIVGLRVFCTHACQFKWRSRRHSGTNNPNWNGGTRSRYYPPEFFAIRDSILARDGYQCAVPFCRTTDSRVHVHHIDYDKDNCSPLNLITACPSCNARANFDRKRWPSFLRSVVLYRVTNGLMNINFRGTMEISKECQ